MAPNHREFARTHMDKVLLGLAGPEAVPRDDQLDAIEAVLNDQARVLVVQATGWGKSAVYWAATSALRSQGKGPTIVVSPLLALMENQVDAATRAGLNAATVNSSNPDDWSAILNRFTSNELDVLLISPERLGNSTFTREFSRIQKSVGLIVIDEAHCISDWGHDFRPDYQRLTRTLLKTPDASVLTTTATANRRVANDIAKQLGPNTKTFRGTLARRSLSLAVVPDLTPLERYAWTGQALTQLEGSGIIYVLTVAEAEKLTDYLASRGHDVAAYTGQTEPERRASLLERLLHNQVKALVATSALGMGYDKPDLGFCLHVGSPSTPVAYYQQVGRAGRALDDAKAVLLPSEADEKIWEFFATATIPKEEDANSVLEQLEPGPASLVELEGLTGLRRGRLEALLKILAVDDFVEKDGSKWATTHKPYVHDRQKWDQLYQVRLAEAEIMRNYARGNGCLMQFLQEVLDDPHGEPCGRCSVCTSDIPFPGIKPVRDELMAAREFLRGADYAIEARKRWPTNVSRKGNIVSCSDGFAVSFADDPGWKAEIAELERLRNRSIPHEFLDASVATLRRWSPNWKIRPTLVVPAPAPVMDANRQLADHIARIGKLPVSDIFEWEGSPTPEMAPSTTAVDHLEGVIKLVGVPSNDGPVLLVSTTARSRWTFTVAGALLREAGVTDVLPFALHLQP